MIIIALILIPIQVYASTDNNQEPTKEPKVVITKQIGSFLVYGKKQSLFCEYKINKTKSLVLRLGKDFAYNDLINKNECLKFVHRIPHREYAVGIYFVFNFK